MRIGQVIKKWRLVSNMECKEAAAMIGLTESTLRRIEKGVVPDGKTLIQLWMWLMGDGDDDILRREVSEVTETEHEHVAAHRSSD